MSTQALLLYFGLQTKLLARDSLWSVGQTTPTYVYESPVGKCPDVSQSVLHFSKLGCALGGRNSEPFCSLNAEKTSTPKSAFS
jgi:hypothetical protein